MARRRGRLGQPFVSSTFTHLPSPTLGAKAKPLDYWSPSRTQPALLPPTIYPSRRKQARHANAPHLPPPLRRRRTTAAMRPPSSSSSSSSSSSAIPAPGGGRMSAFTMRSVARMSRARWFIFLRRVYQYQNGPRSDLGSNPFNSPGWLALELGVIVAQMVLTTAVVATSPAERPAWPLRLWVAAYNVGNVLSLPLLYWRHRHSSAAAAGRGGDALSGDLEMHGANDALRSSSYLMNKARAFLELFFAMWFVMGNVWVFDARLGSFQRAPRLYALCISLLAWNAVVYSLPFLLFLLLCCFVPMVGYALGYNMNSASVGRGASDEQLAALPRWRFKEPADVPRDREHDDQECCICLAQYREKEEVRQLPCTHMFHLKCVDRWLRIISSCPLCKQELK